MANRALYRVPTEMQLQLNMNIKETKKNIIQAGHKAVEELIKVAKEAIVDSG